MAVRKDTLTLTFDAEPTPFKRPSNLELFKWLQSVLKVQVGELRSVEPEHGSRRYHLKFKAGGRVEELVKLGVLSIEYASVVRKVSLSSSGLGLKFVKVKNVPIEVSNADVRLLLSSYGEIDQVSEDKYSKGSVFEGLYNGTRIVKMIVAENIPNVRKIGGVQVYIEYSGQKPLCFICASGDHLVAGCPNKKTKPRQPSWADKVAGGNLDLGIVEEQNDPKEMGGGGGDSKVPSEIESEEMETEETKEREVSEPVTNQEETNEKDGMGMRPFDEEENRLELENSTSEPEEGASESQVLETLAKSKEERNKQTGDELRSVTSLNVLLPTKTVRSFINAMQLDDELANDLSLHSLPTPASSADGTQPSPDIADSATGHNHPGGSATGGSFIVKPKVIARPKATKPFQVTSLTSPANNPHQKQKKRSASQSPVEPTNVTNTRSRNRKGNKADNQS